MLGRRISLRNSTNLKKAYTIVICWFFIIGVVPLLILSEQSTVVEVSDQGSRGARTEYINESEPNNDFNSADELPHPLNNPRIGNGSLNASDTEDYWYVPADRGTNITTGGKLTGAANADKFGILLDCITSSVGFFMELYDADHHLLSTSTLATTGNPASNLIVAQVNSKIFIKVFEASGGTGGQYRLNLNNFTEPTNPAFDGKNRFCTAKIFNIYPVKKFNNEFLSYTHDNADFYKFNATKAQMIDITMSIGTVYIAPGDFDLYLFEKPDAKAIAASSTTGGPSGSEQIKYANPINQTLYLRVVVNISGPMKGGEGTYNLVCSSNQPPFSNTSFPNKYNIFEDGPPFFIDLNNAFLDNDANDQIEIGIWDDSLGS